MKAVNKDIKSKKIKIKKNTDNHVHNSLKVILSLSQACFLIINWHIRVTSRVAEHFKI